MDRAIAEKKAFFQQLDHMTRRLSDDDDLDEAEEIHRQAIRAFHNSCAVTTAATTARPRVGNQAPSPSAAPKQISSAPTPKPPTRTSKLVVIHDTPSLSKPAEPAIRRTESPGLAADTSFVEDTPVPGPARGLQKMLRRAETNPLPGKRPLVKGSDTESPSVSSKPKRRKRGSSPLTRSVPEPHQIFRGLSFFFIPNDAVNKARKLRITKAQEHGASWRRMLDAGTTHVVVDKNLGFKDIQRILAKIPSDAPKKPIIVNEEYPIQCIQYRGLLNPNQHQYRVAGYPSPEPRSSLAAEDPNVSEAPLASQNSVVSLELKAPQRDPARWDYEQPRGTPSRSEESSQASRIAGARVIPSSPLDPSGTSVAKSDQVEDPSSQEKIASTARQALGDGGLNVPRSPAGPKDELSEYIEMMQQYKDLPLDEDQEDETASAKGPYDQELASDDDDDDNDANDDVSEEEREKKKNRFIPPRRQTSKELEWKDRFACHQGGTKDKQDTSPNARTIEVLQKMLDYYTRVNDQWRTLAYRKACSVLKRQTIKITTAEEAYKLPSVGHRLALKIEEIASTNRLRRLEYAHMEPTDKVLQLFLGIYGVGNSLANSWIAQGHRTLDDLKEKAKLTTNQRLGIEHYDDLNSRIPREEVKALGDYVRTASAAIDPGTELIIGGSYRRGSDSSGDIDLIVTKKGTTSSGDLVAFLQDLVTSLTQKGFITARLAALHERRGAKDGPGSKWHGCCVLPRDGGDGGPRPAWRRIDFLLVPETELGAALIYFTGNDIFNRSMRLLASRKGMRLNQRGLYKDVLRGPNRARVTEGKLLEGRDERRIFEILGVEWREPSERWC